MRICPRCKKLYENKWRFCTDDGVVLIYRNFQEKKPKNFSGGANVTEILRSFPPIIHAPAASGRPKRRSSVRLIGLLTVLVLLSGTFVWAAISVVVANQPVKTVSMPDNSPSKSKLPETTSGENSKPAHVPDIGGGKNAIETTAANLKKPEVVSPSKTPRPNQFNGRVVMLNAILRAAPTMEADEAAILALDEPIKIGKKASANSPWYQVVTASGAKGWMHGNTIEFN